jgi:hypothetical protein
MPLAVTKTTGGTTYASPFVGRVGELLQIVVDISGLDTKLVDADGYLKPGAMFKSDGTQPNGSGFVYGVNPEPIKIVDYVPTDALLAADVATIPVGCVVSGVLNRDIIEDNFGRAMTANEIAGLLPSAGARFTLTNT